jgi:glycosyltransferase involved in cell wall biosynthesis
LRIYWYWPHPHAGPSKLALATLRPGDELVVQALPSLNGRSFPDIDEYEVVRDLPDPTEGREGRLAFTRSAVVAVRRSVARRRLTSRDFDLAHLQLLTYQTDWADLRAVRRRMPVVSIVHDVRPHRHALPARLEDLALRRLYRDDRAGHLVVYHDVLRQELIDEFEVAPDRVSVIPLPFHSVNLRDPTIQRETAPFALLHGSLRTNKGTDILIEALEMLGPDTNVRVVVAGAGSADIQHRLTLAAQRLPALQLELGWTSASRLHELHCQASLIVLPYTEFHSMSAVLVSAYAYRVPVIVTDVGALGPSVRDDDTGWVIPPRDAAALAGALKSAFDSLDSDSRESALAAAAASHHTSQVGPMLRNIYDRCV